MSLILSLFLLLFSLEAGAQTPRVSEYGYPWARSNSDLCDELIEQSDRKVPQSSWFCAGADADVFVRTLGSEDFYHGVGHWVQLRAQANPTENVRMNLRTLLYSGSISYGYTRPLGFFNLLGFTADWPDSFWGGRLTSQVMDLGRQTIGAGLLIQEHETAGILVNWSKGDFNLKLMGDGTGGLLLSDDLKNYELSWKSRALALGYIEWTEGNRGNRPFRHSLSYVSSEVAWTDVISTAFEVDHRHFHWASLARISAHWQTERWNLLLRLEGRSLENGFGEQFTQRIEHLYTSYDQYDQRFMNTANILTIDDQANAGSLDINLAIKIGEKYEVQMLNEAVRFAYAEAEAKDFFFYRWGIAYIPKADEYESLIFFVSNKVLTDSLSLPPFLDSSQNVMKFKSIPFFGLEARLRF